LTVTGPYAYTRNPLYLGSAILALGAGIATRSWLSGLILIVYFAVFYSIVMRHRRTSIFPSRRTATPAESYPRYSRRLRPSKRMGTASCFPTYPTMPHILLSFYPFSPFFPLTLPSPLASCLPPASDGPAGGNARRRAAHPGLFTCKALAIASASAGTFSVTVDPAAITAPRPTVTGATNCVSLPTNTSSSMTVSCLRDPSEVQVIVPAP